MKSKSIFLLLQFLSLFCFQKSNYAQSNGTGAIFLSDAEYAQLPRPNWDTLKKYFIKNIVNQQTVASNSISVSNAGVTMLVSPVIGDQGSQWSCIGWAFGYTAMGILTYPKYYCWSAAERSPSFVYNQIKIGTSCGSSSYGYLGAEFIKTQGVCSWSLMPYSSDNCVTQPNTSQQNDAVQNKAHDWVALNKSDVNGIKKALDLGFPVVNLFSITPAFDRMWYNGNGIWSTNSDTLNYDHATCIIGYDDTKQMFKVQNQWGTSSGDNGYYWVTYNMVANNCMKDLYIVYGTSGTNYPAINGNSIICSSENYSINNLPNNVSVTWSSIPANTTSFSCTNCSQTTITKQTDYSTTIQATLTDNCTGETSVLYKDVTLGVGGSINFTQKFVTCENSRHYFYGSVESRPSATNYAWYVKDESNANNPFVLKETGVANSADFPLSNNSSERYYTIRVIATNACGDKQSINEDGLVFASSCFNSLLRLAISPNPTANVISVELVNDLKDVTSIKKEKIVEI